MKKITLFFILLTMVLFVSAQDSYWYYKMRENGSGDGEWLANSKKWLNYWGIQFAAGNKVRGTLSSTGSWYFAAPSTEYDVKKFNTINERLKSWTDVAIGTDKGISAKSYFISDLYNNNTIYGVFGLGRNNDPTIRVFSDNWLRIGSKSGIAMWGNDNAASNNEPHVLLSTDGTLNVHYNIRALVSGTDGGLYLKSGRNADPTILTHNSQWLRIGGKAGVYLWGNDNADKDDNPTMSIVEGNVGIGMGVNKPTYKLDIRNGAIRTSQNNIEVVMTINSGNTAGWLGTKTNHPLCLGANDGEAIYIDGSQRIYVGLNIGTINNISAELKNKYDLFVDKGILSEDYAIAPKSTWSDFVFEKEYNLPALSYIENFITENKHLPNIPSSQEVAEKGYSQHEMNKVLLQKVEELTLYIIEQQKEINELKLQQGQFK